MKGSAPKAEAAGGGEGPWGPGPLGLSRLSQVDWLRTHRQGHHAPSPNHPPSQMGVCPSPTVEAPGYTPACLSSQGADVVMQMPVPGEEGANVPQGHSTPREQVMPREWATGERGWGLVRGAGMGGLIGQEEAASQRHGKEARERDG